MKLIFIRKCQSALGYKLFTKAYDYLKINRNNDPILIREHLISNFLINLRSFWQK